MASRVSALEGIYEPGHYAVDDANGVFLAEIPDLQMWQVAAWPGTVQSVGASIAAAAGLASAPEPCESTSNANGAAMLRVEPLKWWLIDSQPAALDAEQGVLLDLSHSRTRISISGSEAATLLNRHLPLDLRHESFGIGAVASTQFHHVGVTLWRSEVDYQLFLPRGFAVSLWEMLNETAAQFAPNI